MDNFELKIAPDLEARVKALGNSINWSEILRPAIQAAVTALEKRTQHQGELGKDPVKEPPSADTLSEESLGRRAGVVAGRTLDEHAVSALCMIPIATIPENYAHAMVKAALDPENRVSVDAFNHDYLGHANPSKSYLMGFIEGTQHVVVRGEDQARPVASIALSADDDKLET